MKSILIVEDEYFIRDIYEQGFKAAGYSVELAVDGEDALHKANKNNFDMILLDIMIPKLTGIDVLKQLRVEGSSYHDTPIFMTTNLGQDNIIKESLKNGADGYFIKAHMNPENLIAEINNFFAQKDGTA